MWYKLQFFPITCKEMCAGKMTILQLINIGKCITNKHNYLISLASRIYWLYFSDTSMISEENKHMTKTVIAVSVCLTMMILSIGICCYKRKLVLLTSLCLDPIVNLSHSYECFLINFFSKHLYLVRLKAK